MSANKEEALKEARTNVPHESQVEALVRPGPLVFYQPYSGELWVVPAASKAAFEAECRMMDRLMHDLLAAKDASYNAREAWLEAERAGVGPARTVPQHPQDRQQAQKKLEEAEKKLAAAQQKVDEEFKPLDKLDDTGGKIHELIPIANRKTPRASATTAVERQGHAWGKKWTYVRSDKIKSHFRSYRLNQAEQGKHQSQSGSFVKNGKIDKVELGKQLTTLETSAKWQEKIAEVQGTLANDLNRSIKDTLEKWAEGLNGDPKQKVELKPEVQLLRYYAGAGLATSWNPKKGNVGVRADARAEFAIAEGKLTAGGYWPARGGHPLQLRGPKSGKVYDAGLVRFGCQMELMGMAGASACGQLGLEVDYSSVGGRGKKAALRGRPTRKPLSSKGVTLGSQVRDGAELSAAGDLFAGVRVGGSIKGVFQWNDPEKKEFGDLAVIGPGGQVQAGAGIGGQFFITFNNGKFRCLASGSICWGVGAGGKLEFEVDVKKAFDFTRYLAYLLYSVGYEFLQILDEVAFRAWANFSLWAIQYGQSLADAVEMFGDEFDQALNTVRAQFEKESERVTLMNRVLDSPQVLDYAPPETKGMILYQLTRHGTLTKTVFLPANQGAVSPLEETLDRRKQAVLKVIRKARSKAEYRNILQHMTAGATKVSWQASEAHVQRFLDYGIDRKDLDGQMRRHERSLAVIYDGLYDAPVLGYPFVDNDRPQYALNAMRGHHEGYLVAGGYEPGPMRPTFEGIGRADEYDVRYA